MVKMLHRRVPTNNPNVLTVSAIADSDGVCGAVGPDLFLSGDNVTLTDDSFAFFSNFGPVVKIAAPGYKRTFKRVHWQWLCRR